MTFQKFHPAEYHDWAYQLWAYRCDRDMDRVVHDLANPGDGDVWPAREIPIDTLWTWKRRQGWIQRLSNDMRAIAPDLHRTIVANLFDAATRFSEWTFQVSADQVPMETLNQVAAVNAKAKIAQMAFDRIGVIPFQMSNDRKAPDIGQIVSSESPLALNAPDPMEKFYYHPVIDEIAEREDVDADDHS